MITSNQDTSTNTSTTKPTGAAGKPKSLYICNPTYTVTSTTEEGVESVVEQEDYTIVVVTTNGIVLACSSTGLETYYGCSNDTTDTTAIDTASDTTHYESVVRCSVEVSAEPRLTCVVAWTPPKDTSTTDSTTSTTSGLELLSGCNKTNTGDEDVKPTPYSQLHKTKRDKKKPDSKYNSNNNDDNDDDDKGNNSKGKGNKREWGDSDKKKKKKLKFQL